MLRDVFDRHVSTDKADPIGLRLPGTTSYVRLAAMLDEWAFTADAVLLRDRGPALRVTSVAQLQDQEYWPPRGVLAAADATWVLEEDGRVTRLY
jgi:hypothetical protein